MKAAHLTCTLLAVLSLVGTPVLANRSQTTKLVPMPPPADEPIDRSEEVDAPPGPPLPRSAPARPMIEPVLAHPPETLKAHGWRPPPLGPASQPREHRLPTLSGSTGLVDIPVAYTLRHHRGMVTVQAEHFDAGQSYWPNVYRDVKANSQRVHAGYGIAHNTELNLTVENWDHELSYFDPIFGVDPVFIGDNKLFLGIGGKRAFRMAQSVRGAVGARWQFYDERDRNVTELHEYERFSHAFFTASWQTSETLFVHAMFKYVVYDVRGNRPGSGASGAFPGFSMPSTWSQPGIGVEWRFHRHWSVAGEFIADTDVDFIGGVGSNQANFTARYEGPNWSAGMYVKRLDQGHLVNAGVQAGVGF